MNSNFLKSPVSIFAGSFSVLFAMLLISGCAGCTKEEEVAEDPVIVSFSAEPEIIIIGESSTLSWQTLHSVSVEIVDNEGNILVSEFFEEDSDDEDGREDRVSEGNIAVNPDESRTYILTATGEEGTDPVTATVNVTVTELSETIIISFTAEPDTLFRGEYSYLSWTVENAHTIVIEDDSGNSHGTNLDPETGSLRVSPEDTATYTLRATGNVGEDTATATITVNPTVHIVSFEADPGLAILPGTDVTFSWRTAHATGLILEANGEELLSFDSSDDELVEGSVTYQVDLRTEYTLTATGMHGRSDSKTLLVPVIPIITTFLADEQEEQLVVRSGDNVTFSWITTGVDRITLKGPGGLSYEVEGDGAVTGTYSTVVTEEGDYILTGYSGEGSLALDDIAVISIELTDAPRIMSFSALSQEITETENVTLTWVVQAAHTLILSVENIGDIDLSGLDVRSDQVSFPINEAEYYTARLTAINDQGEAFAETAINVVTIPAITHFTVYPAMVASGDSVEISWETYGSVSVRLEKDGIELDTGDSVSEGNLSDTVDEDVVYILRAFNRLGYEVVSEPSHVGIGAPEIISFTSSANNVGAENPLTLSWENRGGVNLEIRLGTERVCETTDIAIIDAGSCEITAPAEVGDYVYTLEISNGAGSDTAELAIYVSDGPIITTLNVSKSILTIGEHFILSWNIIDDADGQSPVIELVDDAGNSWSLEAYNPNNGSVQITPSETGLRTYTFTASTTGTTPAVETFEVEAVDSPVILSFTRDPPVIDTTVGMPLESTLSWEVEKAVALKIYKLDNDNEPIEPPLHAETDLDQDMIDSGSHVVYPGATALYRLVVVNAAGKEVSETVRIVVDGASIVFFTAEPSEIVVGESSTLSWQTSRADSVSLMPGEPSVTETGSPLIDISTTGTELSFSNTDTGQADVVFPSGFVFPYYGIDRTELRVMTDGFISFNMNATSAAFNTTLPNQSGRSPVIAPFWDDHVVRQVYWEHQQTTDVNRIIVLWDDAYRFGDTSGSLNFQLILNEDGTFEFRYGTMSSPSNDSNTTGARATIGFENDIGTEGYLLGGTHNQEIPGGLENRSWLIRFDVPLSGDFVVSPTSDTTYDLTAHSAQGDDWASVEVLVYPAVGVPVPGQDPDEVQIGDDFDITWTVSDAVSVSVIKDGNILCEVPAEIGRCTVPAHAQTGLYSYSVVATGVLEHDQQSADIDVQVYSEFRILSFEAENQFISPGDPVTIEWTTIGAESGTIQRGSDIIPLDPDVLDEGSFDFVQVFSTTDYTLQIEDGAGRSLSETLTVYVNAAEVLDFEASSSVVSAGDTVTLTWDTNNADTIEIRPGIIVGEVSDPFVDISSTGTELALTGGSEDTGHYDLIFPSGFEFPYFGALRTGLRAMTDGFISFKMTATSTWTNTVLPNSNSSHVTARSPVMAPLWDDLHVRGTGKVHWQHFTDPDGDYLVVQWSEYQYFTTSANPADLNFQAVLFEDGTFDFRYGGMTATNQPRADGANSTIGFENDTGTEGYTMSFNEEIPGGLSYRSWRYRILQFTGDSSGSIEIPVDETTTFEICATGGGYTDCQEVTVVVISPGTFMISELMPASTMGDEGQWIELHNTTGAPLDLDGWLLSVDGDEHVISSSVPVEAYGYAVLGRSNDPDLNGGYDACYVYGEDLLLQPFGSTIELYFDGMLIDSFTYNDNEWSIVNGLSLSLHPDSLTGNPDDNLVPGNWCSPLNEFGTEGQLGSPGEPNDDIDCDWFSVVYTSIPNLAIPDADPAGIIDSVTVQESCNVLDISVDIVITHEWIGDLTVDLIAPDGTTVRLHDRTGGMTNDIIGDYPGTLTPHESLDTFIGIEALGSWGLLVADHMFMYDGTLDSWAISLLCN